MLLAPLLRNILMYGGLAIAVIAIIVLRELTRSRPAQRLPDATVVSRKAALRRWLARWWPALTIAFGIGLFYGSYVHRFEYVIVRDGAHGPTVVRRLGTDRMTDITLAPGVKPPDSDAFVSDPVWVLNLSNRTVRVKSVQYGGGALGLGSHQTVLPPHTAAHFLHIDHIGPGDEPPASVRDEVNLGMAFRDWLTWDD